MILRPRLDDQEDKKDDAKAPDVFQFTPIPQALYKARTVLIFGEVETKLAERICATLLALDGESDKPIKVIINSPGGHVESGDTIHDMIRYVKSPVHMVGTGWVASAGVNIYLAAKRENRFALPNTRFMLHQPMGGVRGQASDISIEAEEILKMRERVNRLIARETGQPLEKVNADTERNYWMSAEQAKHYGIVSKIVDNVTQIS